MKGAEERSVTADDIDLKRHAFVEASAGTGKTFLIENITARIVAEGLADIDQLLVVTFTEKAAGELRERIRGRLESGARDAADPVQKERLERSLLRFDGAVVDTIHGFCGQVLRQYGADLGFAPGLELVDDRRTLLDLLRTRMRERWPGDYGDDLVSLLGHTRLATWEDVVPGLAAASLGDILRVKPSGVEPVVHLLRRLAAVTAGGENPEGTEIESLIDPAWKVETIRFLHDDLSRWKDEHGCMSHFDTVDRVAQALGNDSVAGASFLSAMRRRFRYGIVDEFQDTDTRQWSIFKKIFLESPESKLLTVGDPKQAIYGFRGGDIGTFFAAREEMSSQSESQFVSLRINYRASPAVIDACNALFSSDPWFGTGGRITFSNTESAPARLTKFRLEKDPTGTRACVAVKASVETPRMAKRAFQLFMAEEIQTLLSGMEIGEGQKASRLLNAGDIAVLVRNRTDGEFVEKVLEASNIPCSFYKKSDLFGSRESHQLLLLLSWVADPGNPWKMRKALLTDFFRFSLNQVEDSSPGEDVRTLLFHWADLASRRAWPAFFRSIVEDSAFLLGFADSLFGIDGERAALEQIIETLTTEALTRRLDLSGVLDALVRLSAGQGAAEGEDLRRQETEEHRVQIMTIHAAKGLEFPVVFVAGGLTKLMPHMLSYFEYYEETDGRAQRVFDLRKRNKAIEALHLANEVEEDKRLYYVAFTRAALKLYVPIFQYAKSGTYLGPGSRFIREAVEAAQTSGAITVLNVDEAGREVASGARSDSSVPTARRSEPPKREGDVVSIRPGADIPSVSHRMVHVRSYSSIARAMDVVSNATDSAGAHEGRDLDGSAAVEDADDTDSIDSIFRGAAAGNLFHAVLENVDFTEFRESGKLPGLARSLHSTRILNEALDLYGITPEDARYKAARQGAFDVVDRTLNTPLALADGLCLSQLEEKDRIHELEFFLKTDVMHGPLEGLVEKGGYIRGFVDLIFRSGDKFYILDWKSNFIPDGYSRPALEDVMQSHRYHLQASIYVTAVVKWLRSRVPDFDYDRSFGGVFYLFLRGMSPKDPESGVYAFRPTREEAGL